MNGSPRTWTIKVLLERLERGRLLLDLAAPAELNPPAVLDFLESAIAGLPLGQIILCEQNDDDRNLVIVDGLQRIQTIAQVLRPDLFSGGPWPVYMPAPDVPGAGRLLYGAEHSADPAAFPLSAAMRSRDFAIWEAALRNRTPDDGRIKAATDQAHRLVRPIWEANIFVWVLRNGDPASAEVASVRRNANRPFNPARARPGR